MNKSYQDYYWKAGKPYGKGVTDPLSELTYKIVTDAYGKRYSIERYHYGQFQCVVYDSLLLDFRHLNPINQLAWQRECLQEKANETHCLLRNQDDRAILLETHYFKAHLCVSCEIFSVHGLLLAVQRLYYQLNQDRFNGVVLYDLENRPVMMKTYETDPVTSEFTVLLKEEWDMQIPPSILNPLIGLKKDGSS